MAEHDPLCHELKESLAAAIAALKALLAELKQELEQAEDVNSEEIIALVQIIKNLLVSIRVMSRLLSLYCGEVEEEE